MTREQIERAVLAVAQARNPGRRLVVKWRDAHPVVSVHAAWLTHGALSAPYYSGTGAERAHRRAA